MNQILQSLQRQLMVIAERLNGYITKAMTKNEKLYKKASESLGPDPTPRDDVDDELACVSSLDQIFFNTFNERIGGSEKVVGTIRLYQILMKLLGVIQIMR